MAKQSLLLAVTQRSAAVASAAPRAMPLLVLQSYVGRIDLRRATGHFKAFFTTRRLWPGNAASVAGFLDCSTTLRLDRASLARTVVAVAAASEALWACKVVVLPLDICVKGSGKIYDLEMQSVSDEHIAKRARYYQGLMDIDFLDKGEEYETLPESYIVFISKNDPFGLGLPRYTAKLVCAEDNAANEKIDDKTLKVYYNASAWKDIQDKDCQTFLKFIMTNKAEDSLTEDIMEAVETARRNEPWRKEFFYERQLEKRGYARAEEKYKKVIDAQAAEIAQMRELLAQHGIALPTEN